VEGPRPEGGIETVVTLLVRSVEIAGALIIAVGATVAFVRFIDAATRHRHEPRRFAAVRLSLGRYLILGLEFQVASDILRTGVTPTLEALGQLAAVAAIRTALSYVLHKEIEQEQQLPARDGADANRIPGRR
jgi:uncharacterized membrane protein